MTMDARLALAKSNLAQAKYLHDRLEGDAVREDSARSVLWALRHSLIAASEALIEDMKNDD